MPILERSACLSQDRKYRYWLKRGWDQSNPICLFVLLNPSTADETEDDRTVTRCVRYAEDWGYGGLVIANLFAYRATDRGQLKREADPVGPDNDRHLATLVAQADKVICAWGTDGYLLERDRAVQQLIGSKAYCLTVTKDGYPHHPVRLSASLTPTPYHFSALTIRPAP